MKIQLLVSKQEFNRIINGLQSSESRFEAEEFSKDEKLIRNLKIQKKKHESSK